MKNLNAEDQLNTAKSDDFILISRLSIKALRVIKLHSPFLSFQDAKNALTVTVTGQYSLAQKDIVVFF